MDKQQLIRAVRRVLIANEFARGYVWEVGYGRRSDSKRGISSGFVVEPIKGERSVRVYYLNSLAWADSGRNNRMIGSYHLALCKSGFDVTSTSRKSMHTDLWELIVRDSPSVDLSIVCQRIEKIRAERQRYRSYEIDRAYAHELRLLGAVEAK